MRFLVQRVVEAEVSVDGQIVGKIGQGLLVFIGINSADVEENLVSEKIADKMVKKLVGLRIFSDENGKTNLDIKSVGGQLLLISQFTLYADCRKGNRPSFVNAAAPDAANALYQYIIASCRQEMAEEGNCPEELVQKGRFGAHMKVSLVNDGPFTVMLDSSELRIDMRDERKKDEDFT